MKTSVVIDGFKKRGFKITKNRKAIIEIFSNSKSPLTAMQILEYLSSMNIQANKTTVYREIAFLMRERIIGEMNMLPNVTHYELSDLNHHHHFVCTGCQNIAEVDCDGIELGKLNDLANRNGFKITDHKFEIYGMCSKCL